MFLVSLRTVLVPFDQFEQPGTIEIELRQSQMDRARPGFDVLFSELPMILRATAQIGAFFGTRSEDHLMIATVIHKDDRTSTILPAYRQ